MRLTQLDDYDDIIARPLPLQCWSGSYRYPHHHTECDADDRGGGGEDRYIQLHSRHEETTELPGADRGMNIT